MQHTTEVSLKYADIVEFRRQCEEELVEDVDVSVQAVHVVGGRGCWRCWRDCSDGCEVGVKFQSPATQAVTLRLQRIQRRAPEGTDSAPWCTFRLVRLMSTV